MKKIRTLFIVLCFVLGGLSAAAFQQANSDNYGIIKKILEIDKTNLTIEEKEQDYCRISFSENYDLLLNPGKPILPKIRQLV